MADPHEVRPYEAYDLPELPVEDLEFIDALRRLMTAVNGFPYPGDRSHALDMSLRWMRANPDEARVLLGETNE